jgi:hypothetical protein
MASLGGSASGHLQVYSLFDKERYYQRLQNRALADADGTRRGRNGWTTN